MAQEKKYGSWSSPISATIVQKNPITYQYLCQDQKIDNTNLVVYWIELRSDDNGRNIIVSRNINSDVNAIWTPEGFSARTRVHEYGSADCFVYSGIVYFSNDKDQHLYKQTKPQSAPIRVSQKDSCRYANGFYSGHLETIFIVREDHSDKKNVINTIVTIRGGIETILVEGADFYSSPRVSNDGKKLCWIEWEHPNMPWDNTRLCVAKIDEQSLALVQGSKETVLTGSDTDQISCILPTWTADNNLCYVSDESGYWNLWRRDLLNVPTNLTPVCEDVGDAMWRFDTRKYNYLSAKNEVVVVRKGGRLEYIKVDGSNRRITNFGKHLSFMSHCQLMSDGTVVAMGYSSVTRKTIYRLWEDGRLEVLAQNPLFENIDSKYFSVPKLIKYPVPNSYAYGYYYAPCNPDFCAPAGTLPPLLVQAHGGPTSATITELRMPIQYWTSRGYAVFDVDYRGSAGYGKEYRNLLKGKWGILDQEDCAEGAKYLISQKLVNKDMVAIRGGSAGGYTALCCLTFTSVFKAGSSCYGIGDLTKLLEDTHKFESRYMDNIVGNFLESPHLYHERSPINYPERISCPVIFFQGDEDRVVPKEQSEIMFNAAKARRVPCSLVIYNGEQHGFRKMENIIHNLESEYYFFAQIFGFETPGITDPSIDIENLSR